MDDNSGALIVFGCVVLYYVLRWVRVRRQLFRITDKVDGVMRAQGLPSIDFFRTPKLRKQLSLAQIADRLEQRIDRLLDEPVSDQGTGPNKGQSADNE